MIVRPMIGSWEVPCIEHIGTLEGRRVARLPVPGLQGDLQHDLGTDSVVVEIIGSLAGDTARDDLLQNLRDQFHAGKPVPFVADILTATKLDKVLIESLEVKENNDSPSSFSYRVVLREYVEPPPPASPDELGAELEGELGDAAKLGLDGLDLPALLGSIPDVGDPEPPLRSALSAVEKATEAITAPLAGLKTALSEGSDVALAAFLDAVTDYLKADLSPAPALVGGAEPDGPQQLPALTLSLAGVTSPHPGVGSIPSAPLQGALATAVTVNLATPWLDFPDGRLELVSASTSRKILQLPHGGLVRNDGTRQPLRDVDLGVIATGPDKKAKTYAIVAGPPSTTLAQVQADAAAGTLTFGTSLPVSGTVDLKYFVGTWEVRCERIAGELRIDAYAGDIAGADGLSRRLEASLAPDRARRIAGLRSLSAAGWSSLAPSGQGALAGVVSRRRSVIYRFDYERQEPVVVSSGGPIRRVHVEAPVSAGAQSATDKFDVMRKGSR